MSGRTADTLSISHTPMFIRTVFVAVAVRYLSLHYKIFKIVYSCSPGVHSKWPIVLSEVHSIHIHNAGFSYAFAVCTVAARFVYLFCFVVRCRIHIVPFALSMEDSFCCALILLLGHCIQLFMEKLIRVFFFFTLIIIIGSKSFAAHSVTRSAWLTVCGIAWVFYCYRQMLYRHF